MKLANRCSVPVEDLIVFLNVPDCAIIMPTNALKLLEWLDLDVAALDHDGAGSLSLVKQSGFRHVSAERLLEELQP